MDRASLLALAALLTAGCSGKPGDAGARRAGDATKVEAAPATKAAPEFVKASSLDAGMAALGLASQEQATRDGRRLVVYVGAPWCEPCLAFHAAVEAGKLDTELAGIRFLEFDADEHRAAIDEGGYGGRLIPRFALPGV